MSPLQSLLIPYLQSPSSNGETTIPSLLMKQVDEREPLSVAQTPKQWMNPLFYNGSLYMGKVLEQ